MKHYLKSTVTISWIKLKERLDKLYDKELYSVINTVARYTTNNTIQFLIRYYISKEEHTTEELALLVDRTVRRTNMELKKLKDLQLIKRIWRKN